MFRSILSYKSEFNDNFNLEMNSRVQAYKKKRSRIQNFKDIINSRKNHFYSKIINVSKSIYISKINFISFKSLTKLSQDHNSIGKHHIIYI
jgi:hypothetical protein